MFLKDFINPRCLEILMTHRGTFNPSINNHIWLLFCSKGCLENIKMSTCVWTFYAWRLTILSTYILYSIFSLFKVNIRAHLLILEKHQHSRRLRWNILVDAALLGGWCNGVGIGVVVPGDWLVSEPGPPLKSFQPGADQSPNELIFS